MTAARAVVPGAAHGPSRGAARPAGRTLRGMLRGNDAPAAALPPDTFSQGEMPMIAPLRTLLITLWAFCVAGAVVIAGLALGAYDGWTFVAAGVTGALVGVPAGLMTWARLRPNKARRLGY